MLAAHELADEGPVGRIEQERRIDTILSEPRHRLGASMTRLSYGLWVRAASPGGKPTNSVEVLDLREPIVHSLSSPSGHFPTGKWVVEQEWDHTQRVRHEIHIFHVDGDPPSKVIEVHKGLPRTAHSQTGAYPSNRPLTSIPPWRCQCMRGRCVLYCVCPRGARRIALQSVRVISRQPPGLDPHRVDVERAPYAPDAFTRTDTYMVEVAGSIALDRRLGAACAIERLLRAATTA